MKINNIAIIKATACILAAMVGLASTASAAVIISPGGAASGGIEVNGGSTLTWTDTETANAQRILNITGAGSTFIMESGVMTVGQNPVLENNGGYLKVQNGGLLQISGGALTWDGLPTGGGTIQVIGNAATITGWRVGEGTTYDFDFTSAGISTVTLADYAVLGTSVLDVNVGAYNFSGLAPSASQSFTLFDTGNLDTGFDLITADVVTISGLNTSLYSWELVQDVGGALGNDNVSLMITAVPEPATFALMGGLLALGWVMMRRRS